MSDFFVIDVNFSVHIEDELVFGLQTGHFVIVSGENTQALDFSR